MYKVLCDGATLYDPRGGDDNALLDAVLSLESNKTGSFEFTVPLFNSQYENIETMKNRIVLLNDNSVVWVGRPITIEKDWNLNKRVTCEGWISVLKDAIITKYALNASDADDPDTTAPLADVYRVLFARFNQFMADDTDKYVSLGQCDFPYTKTGSGMDIVRNWLSISVSEDDRWKNTYFDLLFNGLDAQEDSEAFPNITEAPYNGHIVPRYSETGTTVIDILADTSEVADQKIEFAKNLLDLTQYIDPNENYSIIYPCFANVATTYLDGTSSPRKNVSFTVVNNGVSGERNGITYTKSGTEWTIEGTATAASTWTIIDYKNGLPSGLIAGKKYTVEYSLSSTYTRIAATMSLYSGAELIESQTLSGTYTFTIPENVDGITVDLSVSFGSMIRSTTASIIFYTASFTDGKLMENPTAVNLLGRIIHPVEIPVDNSSYIDTQAERDALAAQYLAAGLQSALTVTVSALDLSLLGVDVDAIELYKNYEIVSAPHDFDEIYQCTGVKINLLEPQSNEYQFGATRETLTGWVEKSIKQANNKASSASTTASTASVTATRAEATAEAAAATATETAEKTAAAMASVNKLTASLRKASTVDTIETEADK